MRMTLDINDELLARAKRYALETGSTLRAVVEDGLRRVLDSADPTRKYVLPDLRAGDPSADDPMEQYIWPELRDLIYRDPAT